jgi:HSP20 family protein
MANVSVKADKAPAEVRSAIAPSWDRFRDEMNRLFDRFSAALELPSLRPLHEVGNFWQGSLSGLASMAVDVSEDEKSYRIAAELPGLDEKDVEVTVNDDVIVIKGEKTQEKEQKDNNHYLSERSYGIFRRSFVLPKDVDRKAVSAKFAKGVLTVTVPRNPVAQTIRKVEVKAA